MFILKLILNRFFNLEQLFLLPLKKHDDDNKEFSLTFLYQKRESFLYYYIHLFRSKIRVEWGSFLQPLLATWPIFFASFVFYKDHLMSVLSF